MVISSVMVISVTVVLEFSLCELGSACTALMRGCMRGRLDGSSRKARTASLDGAWKLFEMEYEGEDPVEKISGKGGMTCPMGVSKPTRTALFDPLVCVCTVHTDLPAAAVAHF